MRALNPAASLAPLLGLIAGAAVLATVSSPGHAQITALKVSVAPAAVAALNASSPANAPAAPAPAAVPAHPGLRRLPVDTAEAPSGLHIGMVASDPASRMLSLSTGKSAYIDLPADAKDVLVTNPAVADAVLRSRRRISILGLAPGETDAVFFDAAGKCILSLNIRVGREPGGLADALGRILPGSKIRVESLNDSLILSGEVSSAADAQTAQKLAASFTAKPDQVVNLLSITGREQVMLKVRVVEMQRNIIKQLGFNLNAVTGQLGMAQYGFANSPTYGVNGSFMGGATGGYSLNTTSQPVSTSPTGAPVINRNPLNTVQTGLAGSTGLNQAQAMLQAFERVGLVRTLAEPNLTAISGESAKFLAGGEFPVPVAEDNEGRITVEFKPYGVGLGFTPVVLSEGRISLKISTEVSELSTDGGFTLASSTGVAALSIPGLKVRRTETTVELPSGGAMMIAGLMQQQTKQNIDALPGMANLPVLGALFRSRDYLSGETELVVIVTPYLVKPTSPDQLQTPTDGLKIADDINADLLGQMNKPSKTQAAAPTAATDGKNLQGPYGYVIE